MYTVLQYIVKNANYIHFLILLENFHDECLNRRINIYFLSMYFPSFFFANVYYENV